MTTRNDNHEPRFDRTHVCMVCGADVWQHAPYFRPSEMPANRGAWGERFEYEGDKYDPSNESLPEGEFI